jgi:hypothetical protein
MEPLEAPDSNVSEKTAPDAKAVAAVASDPESRRNPSLLASVIPVRP